MEEKLSIGPLSIRIGTEDVDNNRTIIIGPEINLKAEIGDKPLVTTVEEKTLTRTEIISPITEPTVDQEIIMSKEMTIEEMSGIIVEQVIGMMTALVKCMEIEVQAKNTKDTAKV